MRISIWLAAGVAAVAAVVFAFGYTLPQTYENSRTVELDRPADEVYAVVSDFRNYPNWWPEVTRIEVMVDSPQRTTYRQFMMSNQMVILRQREATPPARYATEFDDPDLPYGGWWSFEIVQTGENRSKLTIAEHLEIYNPLYRAYARVVTGYTGRIDSFATAIAERLKPF